MASDTEYYQALMGAAEICGRHSLAGRPLSARDFADAFAAIKDLVANRGEYGRCEYMLVLRCFVRCCLSKNWQVLSTISRLLFNAGISKSSLDHEWFGGHLSRHAAFPVNVTMDAQAAFEVLAELELAGSETARVPVEAALSLAARPDEPDHVPDCFSLAVLDVVLASSSDRGSSRHYETVVKDLMYCCAGAIIGDAGWPAVLQRIVSGESPTRALQNQEEIKVSLLARHEETKTMIEGLIRETEQEREILRGQRLRIEEIIAEAQKVVDVRKAAEAQKAAEARKAAEAQKAAEEAPPPYSAPVMPSAPPAPSASRALPKKRCASLI
jgi:hypothetical protein